MTQVTARSVAFGYGRKKQLFTGLDLTLRPNSIYGLLGKNGAGKTTLLKLLCGLLFPRAGSIDTFGFAPQERHPDMLQDIFLLPEEFEAPGVTVERYRDLYAPLYPSFDARQFASYAAEFEIDPSDRISQMSYGQKKKALLAFGLASNTRLLLLDEPTNGLDIPSKGQFRRLLAGAANEDRIIVVSTHQVRDMENLIDPVVILDDGKIIFDQPMESVSERLSVVQARDSEVVDGFIYSERVMGGQAVLSRNMTNAAQPVDLELLFNAVTTNPKGIAHVFSNGNMEVSE